MISGARAWSERVVARASFDGARALRLREPNGEDELALDGIDTRSRLLDADRMLDEQLDPYVFLRTTYLQSRQGKVFDGNPPKPKFDFDDDE